MRITLSWALFFHYVFGTLRFVIPHKYPVPRQTRVRVESYTHRTTNESDAEYYSGTVLGPEHRYVGPFEKGGSALQEGVYLTGDSRWNQLWVVQLDDVAKTLEQHDLTQSEFVSGYRWGIPLLHWLLSPPMRSGACRRVGNLPYPIEYYPDDTVVYAGDPQQRPRKVSNFWFGLDGRLTYSLIETLAERKEKYEQMRVAAARLGKNYVITGGPDVKYHQVPGGDLVLTQRGNRYHLVHGAPEDLAFPHVTLEVQFWSEVGIYLTDWGNRPRISIDEATRLLTSGEIDSVPTGHKLVYSPIRLPEAFARFRGRAQAAALRYLKEYPGKYHFDVVPKKVLEEYEQAD